LKDIDNGMNNVNTQQAKAVRDQIAVLEDKMKGRAKQIKYLRGHIAEYQGEGTSDAGGTPITSKPAIVPQNLPVFCERNENDKSVITDVEEFADRFERILKAHNLDLDESWKQLLPLCLGKSEANWVEHYVLDIPEVTSWAQARDIVLGHYQSPIRKAMLNTELWTTHPKRNESIRNYCDRFCKLVKDCRIPENHEGLVSRFITSLPVSFQDKLLMVKTANPMYALNSISEVADLVITLDANSKLISAANTNKPEVMVQPESSKTVDTFYCIYHKKNISHNTANCPKLQEWKQSA
jgi:Retrotransposon gag protein